MNACMGGVMGGGGSEVKVKAKFWKMTPFADTIHDFFLFFKLLKVRRDMGPSL